MKRRDLLKGGVVASTALTATPVLSQLAPDVKWRMTSSFPPSLDTLYGGAKFFAEHVSNMTDGRFQIQVFAAGEIVPGLQALDAVSNGTVEMAQTVAYYYTGKNPTFAVASCVPFGLNARQQNAWLYQGGGNELFNAFFKTYNVYGLPLLYLPNP